jgi:molybdopterin converting factor small subunit
VAIVTIPPSLRALTGAECVTLGAANVAALLRALEARYPGFGAALGPRFAVAIDGDIRSDADYEPLAERTEVTFLPPLSGG